MFYKSVCKNTLLWLMTILIFSSCKKSDSPTSPASVNIVNAIPGNDGVVAVFGTGLPPRFDYAQQTSYGNYYVYSPLSGMVPVSIIPVDDTTATFFSGILTLKAGAIYSMYLSGNAPHPDTLFTTDQIPVNNDSVAGVRFINLVPGSQPITVNLAETPGQQEFTNLTYKTISPFKTYPADASIPGSYNFEIHDQTTGDLLTTFTWYYPIFRNQTLVIAGQDISTDNPPTIFSVNNF